MMLVRRIKEVSLKAREKVKDMVGMVDILMDESCPGVNLQNGCFFG